jgi:hypothetical protein
MSVVVGRMGADSCSSVRKTAGDGIVGWRRRAEGEELSRNRSGERQLADRGRCHLDLNCIRSDKHEPRALTCIISVHVGGGDLRVGTPRSLIISKALGLDHL